MSYVFAEQIDPGVYRIYQEIHPYVMRDQGLRAADDLVRVVIGDIECVLRDAGYVDEADKAQKLYEEANNLPWDEYGNWTIDPDGIDEASNSEKLRWILEEAENIDHIYVDWDGDCGVVRVTISDLWTELEGEIDDDY